VARDALHGRHPPEIDLPALRVGSPIVRPGAVLCIGMKLAAHAARRARRRRPPSGRCVLQASNTVVAQ